MNTGADRQPKATNTATFVTFDVKFAVQATSATANRMNNGGAFTNTVLLFANFVSLHIPFAELFVQHAAKFTDNTLEYTTNVPKSE